jgi:hypothetical protein
MSTCVQLFHCDTNNSLWVDMSLHSDTLSWFRANQSLLLLLNAACFVEMQQIPILLLLLKDRNVFVVYRMNCAINLKFIFSLVARNQDNMSECGDMSIRRLFFQWASTIKIQQSMLVKYKADHIIISLKMNLFLLRYSWKIAFFWKSVSENQIINFTWPKMVWQILQYTIMAFMKSEYPLNHIRNYRK